MCVQEHVSAVVGGTGDFFFSPRSRRHPRWRKLHKKAEHGGPQSQALVRTTGRTEAKGSTIKSWTRQEWRRTTRKKNSETKKWPQTLRAQRAKKKNHRGLESSSWLHLRLNHEFMVIACLFFPRERMFLFCVDFKMLCSSYFPAVPVRVHGRYFFRGKFAKIERGYWRGKREGKQETVNHARATAFFYPSTYQPTTCANHQGHTQRACAAC